jgi:hypothetical protein
LTAGLLLLALSAPPAWSQDVVVSTGREGGSYHAIGERLRTAMRLEHDRGVDVLESPGSLRNLELLEDSQSAVNVALAQADALNLYLKQHPDFGEALFVLGDVGHECVLLITGTEGPSRTSALGSARIATDDPGSGSAVTLAALGQLVPAFRDVKNVHAHPLEGLVQLTASGGFGGPDVVMLVQRPSRISPPVSAVLKARKSYRMVEFAEKDVPDASLPDGSPVYARERVTLGGEKHREQVAVDTLCTRGLLIASRAKLDSVVRGELAAVMLNSRKHVVGPGD